MKTLAWRISMACVLVAGLSGCVTTGTRAVEVAGPVAPGPGERVVVDEVYVLVDVSGSMYGADKYRLAKELTRSFVAGMPEGTYRAGLLSYGGEWTNEWVRHDATPLDRHGLLQKTAQIQWLRGSTPLAEALTEIQPGLHQRSGHTAVVILSDGGADRTKALDALDLIKNTHEGPLCVYTVHLPGCGGPEASECCKLMKGCDHDKGCGSKEKECSSKEKACSSNDKACGSKEKECSSDKACDHEKKAEADCCKTKAEAACSSKEAGACASKEHKGCTDHAGCDGKVNCPLTPGYSPDIRVNGHATLNAAVALSGCGHLWEAKEVTDQAGMEGMIRTIFFGQGGDGDEDGDGVPDSLDQCPHTPRGAKVDARGCWVLSGLNFDFDRAEIKPEFEGLLDDVAKVLLDNNSLNINIHVRIDGHTDSIGSAAYNQGLSERRAAAVKAALVKRGVDTARLTTQGFGETKPVVPNKTAHDRYLNRRVELTPTN